MQQEMDNMCTGVRAIYVEVEGGPTRVQPLHDTSGIAAGMVPLEDTHRYPFSNTIVPRDEELFGFYFRFVRSFAGEC